MNRYILNIMIFFCLVAFSSAVACADEQKAGEYQVKALFLYNFLNFVEWPAGSSFNSSPAINVCIVGDDPFGDALDNIRNETVKGKKLVIRNYRPFDEPAGCHLIFIPASEKGRAGQILRPLRDENVLTVSDTVDEGRLGAIIGFFIDHKKVRFAINIEAAQRAGLRISSKLLRLAKIVNPAND